MTDITARLAEISGHGDPAHQSRARELMTALQGDPHDTGSREAAALLVDAYLNDPYLTR